VDFGRSGLGVGFGLLVRRGRGTVISTFRGRCDLILSRILRILRLFRSGSRIRELLLVSLVFAVFFGSSVIAVPVSRFGVGVGEGWFVGSPIRGGTSSPALTSLFGCVRVFQNRYGRCLHGWRWLRSDGLFRQEHKEQPADTHDDAKN
jgi:hypothetical protein